MCSWSHMYMLRWCMCVHVLTSFLIWICVPLISLAVYKLPDNNKEATQGDRLRIKVRVTIRFTCSWLLCVSCLVGSYSCQILWEQGWLLRVREGRGENREEREWEREEHKLEVISCFNFYLTLTFPATTGSSCVGIWCCTFFLSMCSLCHTSCIHFSLLVLFSSSCM